jgi:muramoyltetrapeptide carboxypeptidase
MNLLLPDSILVIEDIAEPIYKVQRILHQLRLSGVLSSLRGLIVGQFTEYRPDANHASMERMIAEMVAPYSYPVAMGAPIGHIDGNMPWIEGSQAELEVI